MILFPFDEPKVHNNIFEDMILFPTDELKVHNNIYGVWLAVNIFAYVPCISNKIITFVNKY